MRKMRTVLYNHTFFPSVGGRELVVHYLAERMVRQGCDVRLVGPSQWYSYRKRDKYSYPVHRYPMLAKVKFRDTGWLTSLGEHEKALQLGFDIKRWGCDVVHAHTTYPAGYIAARLKKRFGFKLVITPHGEDIDTLPEHGYGLRLDPEKREKSDFALDKADAVTAISEGIYQSLTKVGVNPGKIRSIPNGVDCDRFRALDEDSDSYVPHIPSASRTLITVGNYHPRKGHEDIVRAMPFILASIHNAALVIVGRGTDALKPTIEEAGVADNVVLTGPIKPWIDAAANGNGEGKKSDSVAALYKNSDLYVSAGIAEGAEGLSLAVLEAMAAGLPVVGTEITGNRDVITDGVNGFLATPSDPQDLARKVIACLENENFRSGLSDGAYQFAAGMDWTNVAQRYVELYSDVLG
ncbi:MAG: glycosyltransferase family 4 protein [Gammaproteobacteria bacterium]